MFSTLPVYLIRSVAGCALLAGTLACHEDANGPTGAQFVIEGFLYAGQPVDSIRITSTVPLGSTDTTATPIDSAHAVLIKNGTTYALVSAGNGYYRYPGSDLAVQAGDLFQLQASYAGEVATAQTIVPDPPQSVVPSSSVLTVTVATTSFGGQGVGGDSIQISWSNPDGRYYYVTLESLDSSAALILTTSNRFSGRFRLITQPTTSDHYTVTPRLMRVLGPHVARIYRVNKEYADLYANRMQDSRDLNEPPSNVVGALGVFTAFNLQSVYFDVVLQN